MVIEILREDLVRQKKYKIDFVNCKTSELIPKVDLFQPDVVISTAPVKQKMLDDWKEQGIAFFKGTPFLTGVNVEPLMVQLLELLDAMGVRKK